MLVERRDLLQFETGNLPESESSGPGPNLWAGWPTIGFGAIIFFIYFVAQSLVAVVFVFSNILTSQTIDPARIMELITNGLLISVATVVSTVVGVGFIILFIKLRRGASIAEYLSLKSINWKIYLIILAAAIGLLAISYGFDLVVKETQNTNFMINAYNTSVWPVLLWVAVVIFAPAFEEGFFRGFLFSGLRQSRLGAIGTIAFTAITWAALHALQYDLYGVITVLILGIVFGIVRLKTGSLWSTLFLHSLWNFAAMLQTVLYINGVGG
jgi:uncharacterized protein